jgi:hypothetical protein
MAISAPTIVESNKRDIPLSVRILDRFSSPIAVTLAAAVILTAGYLAGEWLTGGLQGVLTGDQDSLGPRATATLFVLAAYVPLAHYYLRRWTAQHLASLHSSFGAIISCQQSAPAGIVAGILGAAIFLVLFILIPLFVVGFPAMSYQLVAATISGMIFGWLAGRFLVCMVQDSLQMSRLARALPELDLIDLRPLSPFVQQGLKSSLLTVIVLALTSHLSIAPGAAVIGSVVFLIIWGTFTLLVFTLPVRGVRDRILREKHVQLEKLRSEIRYEIEQAVDHRDGNAGKRLSALLNLEIRLERVRAWPYDASSWIKLGLYMLIGLGSWVGAAAIERVLEAVI